MELASLENLPQLTRDIRKAAVTLSPGEARTLVDLYYGLQNFRIQASNQTTALAKTAEPHETIGFFYNQFKEVEDNIRKALDTYSNSDKLGAWARLHTGVGPVIAAGLLAHIDVTRAQNPASVWKFAGLAPGQRYVKGERRSWNADLKVLCWKLGDSFVKNSGRDTCYYGKLYLRRKLKEVARNGAVRQLTDHEAMRLAEGAQEGLVQIGDRWLIGGNAAAAAQQLAERTVRDAGLKERLESGKLPDLQLDLRARRWAVKRFLLHYWQAAYWLEYGTQPPRAYTFEQLGEPLTEEEPCPIAMPKP